MDKKILKLLADLETVNNIEIIYAAEVGSRCYGYASQDSGYNVKFAYVRPKDWYISLDVESKGDTFTIYESDNCLSIYGWDIMKVLNTLYKSDTSSVEWFNSNKKYKQIDVFSTYEFRNQINACYDLNSGISHYIKAAECDIEECLCSDTVRIETYIGVLRCITSALWIVKTGSFPPLHFDGVISALDNKVLVDELQHLSDVKRSNVDSLVISRINCLDVFIKDSMKTLRELDIPIPKLDTWRSLDKFFVDIVNTSIVANRKV